MGDFLRKRRLDLDLSQSQVAKKFNVTPDTITNWELNKHVPSERYHRVIKLFID